MIARLAGAALSLLGAVLVLLGLVGLLTIQLVLPTGGSVLLMLSGLVCAALGVPVWRGSRLATMTGLAALAVLLVVEAATLLQTADPEPAARWRLALTAALTGLLALAARSARP